MVTGMRNDRTTATALHHSTIPGSSVQVTDVPEFYLTAVLLEHEKTGAQHLHIARDDDNNAFRHVSFPLSYTF